ncbi:hypothetical protein NP493_92g00007 [Ridgeia piscesae]|uniref:Uncharacterized protein n=1 Tax=Ridgeia piscesae TaxID=27915 RepID=A0AAD9P8B0_RIDPI|nr:hypothetical protein NP493_92g00007 [Ridgeia piscesae]
MKGAYRLLTPKCFEYLLEATTFQLATVHQHEVSSCCTVPRTNFQMKSCLFVGWRADSFDEWPRREELRLPVLRGRQNLLEITDDITTICRQFGQRVLH